MSGGRREEILEDVGGCGGRYEGGVGGMVMEGVIEGGERYYNFGVYDEDGERGIV